MSDANLRFTFTHRVDEVNYRPGRETYVLSNEDVGAAQAYRDPTYKTGADEWTYGVAFHYTAPDSRADMEVDRDCEWTETGTCFTRLDRSASTPAILSGIFDRPAVMREYLRDRFLMDMYHRHPWSAA